ncbi:hypothetical protein GCM10022207_84640 [Streptomyces lannensis]|uniref:DUF2283 domain-containing protein n=1 Tax=Streptomyces lannensis TaxID=766498 RepID=A0ABP7LKT0_9ACTN
MHCRGGDKSGSRHCRQADIRRSGIHRPATASGCLMDYEGRDGTRPVRQFDVAADGVVQLVELPVT